MQRARTGPILGPLREALAHCSSNRPFLGACARARWYVAPGEWERTWLNDRAARRCEQFDGVGDRSWSCAARAWGTVVVAFELDVVVDVHRTFALVQMLGRYRRSFGRSMDSGGAPRAGCFRNARALSHSSRSATRD